MSSSTITPAVRSSLEKYKDKYQKLKDTYAAKVTENNSFEGGVTEVPDWGENFKAGIQWKWRLFWKEH